MGADGGGNERRMNIKPILMNTEMTRAILEDRKTATRRVIKEPYYIEDVEVSQLSGLAMHKGTYITHGMPYPDSPYSVGDVLYVRETWQFIPCISCNSDSCAETPKTFEDTEMVGDGCFVYRADYPEPQRLVWRPSIHMPKEAARIWLRVTDMRVERLQDIDDDSVVAEGLNIGDPFDELWDSTIKPTDRERYGWSANPWVWVIEFERCEKPMEEG